MNEIELLKNVIDILKSDLKITQRYEADIKQFEERISYAKSNKYRLGVIGVTSSGKSTMINAFLGEELLPEGARPSSSQLVSCFKDSKRQARVLFADNSIKTFADSQLNSVVIEKYADERTNVRNQENVKQIEISTPNFCFSEDFILVDSPGLDAFGYENHEQLTMNSLLPTVDFCIFVTTCKTNSDEKMKMVLDTIADYEKPVIIVQNMIDAILPTPDGKKSKEKVAQEHLVRIERIIENSRIRDKASAHIVQISAKWALEFLTKPELSSQKIFEKSNFEKLVETVNSVFASMRPRIENHRLVSAKKEIERLIKEAKEDGNGEYIEDLKFEFENLENQIHSLLEKNENELNLVFNSLEQKKKELSNSSVTEKQVKDVKQIVKTSESIIVSKMKEFNSFIIEICEKLNVDSRIIVQTDGFSSIPKLKLKTTTVTKKKKQSGFSGGAKRFFGGLFSLFGASTDDWGYNYVEEKVVMTTIEDLVRHIENALLIFTKTVKKWMESVEKISQKLSAQIENKRLAFESRKENALNAAVYKEIAQKLESITENLPVIEIKEEKVNCKKTDYKSDATFKIEVPESAFLFYKLSKKLMNNIHKSTMTSLLASLDNKNEKNLVIGWDKFCETRFVNHAFGCVFSEEQIEDGANEINATFENPAIKIVHNPSKDFFKMTDETYNVFILVHATQIGSAQNQINQCGIASFLKRMDNLFFVVQDLAEIITGESLTETLESMKNLGTSLKFNKKGIVLLEHENPVFNLCGVEAQIFSCQTQADEIKIIGEIQNRFPFLRNKETDLIIQKVISILGKK